jgi:SSS family solute:Na+ symporter
LSAVDYIVVAVYLLIVLAAGFWFTKRNKGGRDFFVGGNRIPWWAAGISLYMTTFSAWMFTGGASFIYNTGWFGILWLMAKPVSFLIGFLLSAVRWRRARITSPVEYVEDRYNHTTRLVLSTVLVISLTYWPGHHLASLAKISAPALLPGITWGVDALILFFGVFVVLYTIAGGIWAVSITDVLQFAVLFVVCTALVIFVFASGEMGSIGEFVRSIPALETEYEVRSGTVYTHWYVLGFLAAGIFGNVVGDKAQRFFTVRDELAVKRAGWIAFALFAVSPILFGVPPLVGKVLWPEVSQLAAVVGTAKPDESIFIAVVMRYMPVGVVGLFVAAMTAASMSALDSVWNTVAAVVSVDLYKGHFRREASDRELLWIARVTIAVLAVLAVSMALLIVHSSLGIFTISNIVLGLVVIPVTIPLMVGIVSRSPSTWSAVPTIISGILISAVTRFDLNWTLGPQYLSVILVCLLVQFASPLLGRLHTRGAAWTTAASFISCGILYLGFSIVNAPTMQVGVTRNGGDSFWLIATLLIVAIVNSVFSVLYAREAVVEPVKVNRFFEKLATPIDADAEVGPP